jgi:putative tricarboxylic transport membrane protein
VFVRSGAFVMRKEILGISASGVLMSIVYGVTAMSYPFGSWSAPGPGMYPLCLAVLIFVTSIGMAIESRYGKVEETLILPYGAQLYRILATIGSMLLYMIALFFVGHIIASLCFTFAVLQVIGRFHWTSNIVLTLVITAASYFLFITLLNVPLPRGIWFE